MIGESNRYGAWYKISLGYRIQQQQQPCTRGYRRQQQHQTSIQAQRRGYQTKITIPANLYRQQQQQHQTTTATNLYEQQQSTRIEPNIKQNECHCYLYDKIPSFQYHSIRNTAFLLDQTPTNAAFLLDDTGCFDWMMDSVDGYTMFFFFPKSYRYTIFTLSLQLFFCKILSLCNHQCIALKTLV